MEINTKEQLERKLRELNENEEKQRQDNWLNSEIKQYVGKCYSTHLFQKLPKPGITIRVRKIISCDWDNGNKCPSFKVLDISFNRYLQYGKMNFSIEERTSNEALPSWIGRWSHEISVELFNSIVEQSIAHGEGYFDKIKHLFRQTEYITQGDHGDESARLDLLNDFNLIDLPMEGYLNINDLLIWNRHPFHYGRNKLLNTKESIEIVKKIADSIEKKAIKWGGSIYERDRPRIEKLRSFYEQYKYD